MVTSPGHTLGLPIGSPSSPGGLTCEDESHLAPTSPKFYSSQTRA